MTLTRAPLTAPYSAFWLLVSISTSSMAFQGTVWYGSPVTGSCILTPSTMKLLDRASLPWDVRANMPGAELKMDARSRDRGRVSMSSVVKVEPVWVFCMSTVGDCPTTVIDSLISPGASVMSMDTVDWARMMMPSRMPDLKPCSSKTILYVPEGSEKNR